MKKTSKQEKALELGIELLKNETLILDNEYKLWRCKILNNGKIINIVPRRVEFPSGKGYLIFTLVKNGISYNLRSHRLIWVWMNGPIPDGLQINHKDLNKENNHIDNLELVTPLENTRHAIFNGHVPGFNNGSKRIGKKSTLTLDQINKIASMVKSRFSVKTISKQVGLSLSYTYKQIAKLRASTA